MNRPPFIFGPQFWKRDPFRVQSALEPSWVTLHPGLNSVPRKQPPPRNCPRRALGKHGPHWGKAGSAKSPPASVLPSLPRVRIPLRSLGQLGAAPVSVATTLEPPVEVPPSIRPSVVPLLSSRLVPRASRRPGPLPPCSGVAPLLPTLTPTGERKSPRGR